MIERHDTSGDDRVFFQPYLERGEKVLWKGRPRLHWGTTAYKLFWVAAGCAVLGIIVVLRSRNRIPAELDAEEIFRAEGYIRIVMMLGLVALAFGIWSFVRHLIWLPRVSYLLSDRRAMAFDCRTGKLLKSVSLGEVDQLDQILRSDGSGRVIFDYDLVYPKSGGSAQALPKLEFVDIEAAATVRALAEEAALKLMAKAEEAKP
jgi:hypothetical protein